ncbi:hypothetical protein SBA4_2990015 [Candidatus Sulfopaludibacter sp. SbA4]|nr:hypothetical protein SBA4_2990015 [Candidatus Sulfopaludibacter sp. SbA4]
MSHENAPPYSACIRPRPPAADSGDSWPGKKPPHLSPKFRPSPQPKQTKYLMTVQENARAHPRKPVTTVTRPAENRAKKSATRLDLGTRTVLPFQ